MLLCPSCAATVTTGDLCVHESIGVCPSCARSIVKVKTKVRLATGEDLRGLTAGQIVELRHARPTAWRNDVRARHAAIVARGIR